MVIKLLSAQKNHSRCLLVGKLKTQSPSNCENQNLIWQRSLVLHRNWMQKSSNLYSSSWRTVSNLEPMESGVKSLVKRVRERVSMQMMITAGNWRGERKNSVVDSYWEKENLWSELKWQKWVRERGKDLESLNKLWRTVKALSQCQVSQNAKHTQTLHSSDFEQTWDESKVSCGMSAACLLE